jgi:hypothetical protein
VQTGVSPWQQRCHGGRISTPKVFGSGPSKHTEHTAQARRLLALALIYDGGSRTDAAPLGNVTLQIVRDWNLRFNANGRCGRDRHRSGPRVSVR